MPIYEYHCEACGKVFDRFVRSISSPLQVECPRCHSARCKKNISLFCAVASGSAGRGDASCAPSGG